jgi:hypothetical protein
MRLLPRFELSWTQLIATALAAITATIAASYLGVAGTVIGAAVVSVMSAVSNAVYGHSLRSTHARVREAVPVRRRQTPETATLTPPKLSGGAASNFGRVKVADGGRAWRGAALGAVALFVALLTLVTGLELVTGRPLTDLVRGSTGSGTTVFGDAGAAPQPQPTVTQTVTPSVVVTTPTVTQTAPAVTKTATPTVTPTPTPSVTATPRSASSATPGASGQPTP